MNIGEMIALRRRECGLSQAELAERLNVMGESISNQAVCKWEKGATLPNARQFLCVCRALGIEDVMGEFMGLGVFAGLDALGRKKALEYVELLRRSGMYADRRGVVYTADYPVRSLPLYSLAVSAGTGQLLDGEDYEMVEVGIEVPEGANFGVRVAGDSMEPEFHDGETVWVRQQRSLMTGEIGIFLYDGCAYLKQLVAGSTSMALHSLNPRYEDIVISPELSLSVLGKVLR